MEPLTLPDPAQAAVFTPWVLVLAQVLKQSPRINNAWVPWLCVLMGFGLALGALVANHQLAWVGGQFVGDSKVVWKTLLEGIGGGAGGPPVYELQKQLPFQVLTPGPDNWTSGKQQAAAPAEAQGVMT